MWPPYMTELFVMYNIASYSYQNRNKICLFFWANGATYEVMSTLSEFFAPPERLLTGALRRDAQSSHRKCVDLFKTYKKERHNPRYSRKYYYYSMIEGRMLFLDNTPRHYGQRQSNSY